MAKRSEIERTKNRARNVREYLRFSVPHSFFSATSTIFLIEDSASAEKRSYEVESWSKFRKEKKEAEGKVFCPQTLSSVLLTDFPKRSEPKKKVFF